MANNEMPQEALQRFSKGKFWRDEKPMSIRWTAPDPSQAKPENLAKYKKWTRSDKELSLLRKFEMMLKRKTTKK